MVKIIGVNAAGAPLRNGSVWRGFVA